MHLLDNDRVKAVAEVKRVLEWCTLIPGFEARLREDTEGVLKELGLDLEPRDIQFKPFDPSNALHMEAVYEDSKGKLYADFINAKFSYLEVTRDDCTPSNEAMKKWRSRQMNRCKFDIGGHTTMIIHAPLVIELADGCSVGCEFCGLNAGRLKSVFRYTDENAKLFNDVITTCREVIGKAAGEGTLYFATEPLDNPDYELFNRDYVRVFGRIPQITTAASTRHIERLRSLLKDITADCGTIYRFSLTSEEMARKIFDAFSPEELIFVELLPQYEEAPGNSFVKVGRNADDAADEYGDTISCLSGFRINMCRKELSLSTPTWSSKEHPTGEIILETCSFTDGDDFAKQLKELIRKYMMNIIGPKDEIKLADGILIKHNENGENVLYNNKGMEMTLKVNVQGEDIYSIIIDILKDGYNTKRDVVLKINEKIDGIVLNSDLVYFAINRLWNMGIIRTKSGAI